MKRPKDYISWSQLVAWEKGAEAYEKYVSQHPDDQIKNRETLFGKKIADGLRDGVDDPDVNFCRTWLPVPGEREKEFFIEIAKGVKLKCGLDGLSYSNKGWHVDEYKTGHETSTGKDPWNQKMVDNHGQLDVYDLVIWKLHGIIPTNTLWWIPTIVDENEEIHVAGKMPKAFETKRTLYQIMAIKRRLEKAYKEIGIYYKNKK
jgi:hypothetical protein